MVTAARRSPWTTVAVLLIAGYALAVLLVGSRFMTTDAAKYVNIGRNVLAGKGPVNVFGVFFEFHSPAWPLIVMTPEALVGLDWTLWSRLVQVVCAIAVLALTARMTSPAGPRAALLAVALFAGFPYGFELARDLGLDGLAAASTLAFVVVALRAPAHRATRWGVVAGVTFGIAFLIKEIDLPFAPLPVVMTLLAGHGWRVALRLLGTFSAVAFAITAWWLVLFATETGTVFRLGTPAWTLVPIALGVVAVAVLGLLIGRDAPADAAGLDGSRGAVVASRERILAWAIALGWAILLTAFFERTHAAAGNSLFTPAQYALYLRSFGAQVLPLAILAGIGALVAVWQRATGRLPRDLSLQVDGLVVALVVGLPLILVVIALREPPRHYLVQLAILTGLGAIGWMVALDRFREVLERREDPIRRAARWVVPLGLSGAVLLSGLVVARTFVRDVRAVSVTDRARAAAVDEVGDWLADTVGPGDTVALGSTLRYEIGTRIPSGVRARVVRQYVELVHRPGYPLGIGLPKGPPVDDFVVLSTDAHDTDSFYGYSRGATIDQLGQDSIRFWIDGGFAPPGVELPIDAGLAEASGITPVKTWVWPYGGRELRLTAYRIDPAALAWRGTSLYLDGATLERLVNVLEVDPARDVVAARAILERTVLVDGERPDLTDRLRRIAGS